MILVSKYKDKLSKYLFLFLSVLISVSIFYFRGELSKLASFGYLGIFLINLIGSATIIIPAPSFVATFVGGSIYNPLIVGVLSGIGAGLGELTGYLAGYGGSVAISKNKKYELIEKWMHKNGFLTILILAIVPNPFFDISGVISGATHYSLKKFLTAVLIGKVIRFTLLAFVGKSLL